MIISLRDYKLAHIFCLPAIIASQISIFYRIRPRKMSGKGEKGRKGKNHTTKGKGKKGKNKEAFSGDTRGSSSYGGKTNQDENSLGKHSNKSNNRSNSYTSKGNHSKGGETSQSSKGHDSLGQGRGKGSGSKGGKSQHSLHDEEDTEKSNITVNYYWTENERFIICRYFLPRTSSRKW